MPWSLLRMARYVKQVKYLQQLKDSEDVCNQAFEKGSYLLFCKNRPLLSPQVDNPYQSVINWRSFKEVEQFNPNVKQSSVVLGVEGNDKEDIIPLFACAVPPTVENDVQEKCDAKFFEMRRAFLTIVEDQQHNLARGYAMITWNDTVNFCPYCGAPLHRKFSGVSKDCSKRCDPQKMTLYPQIHPVAIVRVTSDTNDKILLVRQPRHPKGMYTCIAGFMEPGETLNDNIRREIAEEAGIVVENVQYFQTQAWPLPQTSLMLACTAVAMPGSEETCIDKEELEDAKWFTKEEAREGLQRVLANPRLMRENPDNELIIPPRGAIAHQLVLNWLEPYAPGKL